MSLPREPRQKMINMMYLVLTALLALNVSAEILNAFKTVNKSLEITNGTVNNSTETVMKSLEDKMSDPATMERAKKWYPKAKEVQDFAKTAYAFIQGIKDDIIKQGGGNADKASFKSDNLDIATRLMIDKGKAKDLQAQLDAFKKNVLGVDKSIDSAFATTLPINTQIPGNVSKSNNTFARAYFHMVPTVAALTILSKFQNDVKTSENKIIQFLHSKVGEVAVRFDTYNAFAAVNKSYIMPGDEMEVMAAVGAFSKAALPQITIDGSPESLTEDGAAHRKMKASDALGKHTISVTIKYKDLDGVDQVTKKDIEYIVGQSTASIALDKMNVLYVGVENPVSVSASGAGDDKIGFSITGGGGTYTKIGGGKYTVRVNSITDECWITVSVDNKVAGKSKFRVRTVPQAQAYVGGQPSGANVAAGAFSAQGGVQAGIKDFPFELQYLVQSFTFTIDTDEGDIIPIQVSGNAFSPEVRNAMKAHLKAGRLITIDDIRVKGPDGRTSPAPSLIYYIK